MPQTTTARLRKGALLHVRLEQRDMDVLQRHARQRGVTLSQFVRITLSDVSGQLEEDENKQLLRRYSEQTGIPLRQLVRDALREKVDKVEGQILIGLRPPAKT